MLLRLMLWPAGLALGAFSLAIARDEPAFSYAGASLEGAAALLGAGWALLACGLVFWGRRPANAVGPLLAAAGCAWFFAEWDSPGVGSAAVFTIGLVLSAACPPLVAWAMLAYPGGRLASWGERVAVALALAGAVLVLGLLPALVFDPATGGCVQCPDNLLLVADEPELFADLNRVGVHLGLAWALLLIAVAGWEVARSSSARRRVVAPVVAAGSVYLGLVAATFATSLDRGFVGSGALERRLWFAQAGRPRRCCARGRLEIAADPPHALVACPARRRAGRGGSPREVCETRSPQRLSIPSSRLPTRSARTATRTRAGRPVDLARVDGRAATPLVREGRTVAVLLHRTDLLDNPELVEEVASAARLALENERLQAEVRAQLESLRSSRVPHRGSG